MHMIAYSTSQAQWCTQAISFCAGTLVKWSIFMGQSKDAWVYQSHWMQHGTWWAQQGSTHIHTHTQETAELLRQTATVNDRSYPLDWQIMRCTRRVTYIQYICTRTDTNAWFVLISLRTCACSEDKYLARWIHQKCSWKLYTTELLSLSDHWRRSM